MDALSKYSGFAAALASGASEATLNFGKRFGRGQSYAGHPMGHSRTVLRTF